jgi:ketosteroid isomerase-like protein
MAQRHDGTDAAVQQLIDDWVAAELNGDADALARITADDFVGIGPRAFTLTKEQWVERFGSGDLRHEAFALNESSVRRYGDAAMVVGRQVQRAQFKGSDVSGEFRVTLVLVRQAGVWQLVNWQASGPIMEAPPSRG